MFTMKLIVVLCVCGVGVVAGSLSDLTDSAHKCGIEASNNPIHREPWLVHLEYYRRGVRADMRCGGTLISRRHVITAAHCVKAAGAKRTTSIVARLGEYDLSSERDCVDAICSQLPVRINVISVAVHALYDGRDHDVAILTLEKDAPYSDTIRPVCLPHSTLPNNAILTASGWGEDFTKGIYSDIKKHLELPYWSLPQCENAFKQLLLPKPIICAGGEKDVDTCRGDSGGPLTWGDQRRELWGITSTGNVICGTYGIPGIYTSVIDHLDWIRETIEI